MFSCQKNFEVLLVFLFTSSLFLLVIIISCKLFAADAASSTLSRNCDMPSLLKLIEKPLSVMTNSNHRITNSCIVDKFYCAIHTWKQIKTIPYVNVRKTVTSYEWNSLYKVMTFWLEWNDFRYNTSNNKKNKQHIP